MTALLALTAAAWRAFRLYATVSAAMLFVSPNASHTDAALLLTRALLDNPLYEDERLEVAVGTAASFEESSLDPGARGDHGRSCGMLQVFGGCKLSRLDAVKAGIDQIRLSFAMNHDCLWCGFLAGPHGVESARVRRMSRHRERLVARILNDLMAPDLSAAVSVRP